MEALTLIANPGSASRKYGLYKGAKLLARVHFEYENSRVICSLLHGDTRRQFGPATFPASPLPPNAGRESAGSVAARP